MAGYLNGEWYIFMYVYLIYKVSIGRELIVLCEEESVNWMVIRLHLQSALQLQWVSPASLPVEGNSVTTNRDTIAVVVENRIIIESRVCAEREKIV